MQGSRLQLLDKHEVTILTMGVSDTVLLVMDFRDELTVDSALVQPVLGAE